MRATPFTDVITKSAGEPVLLFQARIKRIFNQDAKDDWTRQNLVLADPDDDRQKMDAKLWNMAEVEKNMLGKVVYFQCTKGDKGGWVGVKIDEYKGKLHIKVDDRAEMGVGEPEPGEQQEQKQEKTPAKAAPRSQEPRQQAGKPPAGTKERPTDPKAPKTKEEWKAYFTKSVHDAIELAGKAASLLCVSLIKAEAVFKFYEATYGEPMQPEQFQAITSSIFITLRDQGALSTMPSKITNYLPEDIRVKVLEYAKGGSETPDPAQ